MASETSEALKDGESGRSSVSPDEMKRELEEQFNVQRARMKELFMQKEEDMQRVLLDKQQLESEVLGLRAELQQLQVLSGNQQSEIQNLQLLVSETVEASASGAEEVRRLRARTLELEQHLQQLKQQLTHHPHPHQQELSLAPATLVRSLARKLGADTEEVTQQHQLQQRKNVEEGELMQSIIQPLEMEITALKNKLRENDAKLQEALKANANTTNISSSGDTNPVPEGGVRQCDMCVNYEKQLVTEQSEAQAARERAARLDQALRLATEELEGVRSLHDETVRQWQSSRADAAAQLQELRVAAQEAQRELQARTQEAQRAAAQALETVAQLTVDRQTLHAERAELERDNAILMGLYTKRAAEMQNEIINLPDSVPELQELTLQLREQLIECAIGRERALSAEEDLRSQLLEQSSVIHRQEGEVATVRQQLAETSAELDRLQTEREQMKELGDKLRQSNDMIESLLEDKKRLQNEVSELRARVTSLQQELDNSEKVQQDFVRLSQSLQVQLQRIRGADTDVRWQHDEDVSECPTCRAPLPNSKKKVHCRHCGRIFCAACVSHCVASGPRRLPARVCAVCRTLLQSNAAPYFSTQPPLDA